MKKKYILFILIILVVTLLSTIYIVINKKPSIIVENIEESENIILIDELTSEVYSDVKVSDYIKSINGTIIDDYEIDTKTLGEVNISFMYLDIKNRKISTSFNITVVDTTAPIVLLGNKYTVVKGYNKKLEDVIFSGDNYDNNITRTITGNYDVNKVGEYNLNYSASDSSGNVTSVDFTLNVIGKNTYKNTKTYFNEVIKNYKNDNNVIGIDVSKWQGDINFNKVKSSGADFVMIRIGYQNGIDGESVIDPYFIKNIKEANDAGLKVGIYYYSYARSVEDVKKQVDWIINTLGDNNIDLPITFDWECWTSFNNMNISLYELNNIANAFLSDIENKGFKSMLYSSKYYLEKIWNTKQELTWLAHYTKETDYSGDYLMWQLCDNGIISGINGYVDIDIMYLDNGDEVE